MKYVGIDPGESGGLVMLDANGSPQGFSGMPETEADLWQLLSNWSQEAGSGGIKAFLEKVRSSPQMSKGSIFVFGWGYGALRMALIASSIPFEEVTPGRWQGFLGVRDKTGRRNVDDVDTTAKKNRHKARAQELFPMLKMTHKIADAALIAEYGRRLERGFGSELPAAELKRAKEKATIVP